MKAPIYVFTCLLAFACYSCESEALVSENISDTSTMEAELAVYEAQLADDVAKLEAELDQTPKTQPITVPAGSVNALAAAIQQAGEGGTVILATGLHTESASVLIPHRLRLIGEKDAILVVDTEPSDFSTPIEPAVHIKDAPKTLLRGFEIRSSNPTGGAGVLFEDSNESMATDLNIVFHQFGMLLEASDHVVISKNEITGDINAPFATGILTMKGDFARVFRNEVSGFFAGIWACSRWGIVSRNEMFGNFIGFILCRATPGAWPLPSGELTGSDFSAFKTAVTANNSHDNFDIGYQAIDGANNNFLALNRAANNARADYEFAQETNRYNIGFPLPTSFENRAWIARNHTYVDCGVDNVIIGGDEIPPTSANCF